MPEIIRFFGIVIRMFFDDHNPPHFHAEFQAHRAIIDIQNVRLLDGTLPPKQLKQVQAWALLHRQDVAKRNPNPLTFHAPFCTSFSLKAVFHGITIN
ncbi:DUF4160 domain-containing protein [Dyadobacter fermentans]|uniref:DUF4160 domain-containing protein n=1 Tax=Dyadobacter fermentans TaxID=94254 RepID=UPI001CBBF81A|nr:DUF4160 domain-containing protein [Dyadobacter fermentans]MBZ1357473.1 DUF4160 domain-containing protein [Dyadobacter fermentans]